MKQEFNNRYERAIYHANLLRHLPLFLYRGQYQYQLRTYKDRMVYYRGKRIYATGYGETTYEMAENLIKELGIDLNSPPEPDRNYTEVENELETKTQTIESDNEPTQS